MRLLKINALKLLIHEEKSDFIGLNEIKCLDPEANGDLSINGYDSFFKWRTAKGGGVALFISKKITYGNLKIPEKINDEILGIKNV